LWTARKGATVGPMTAAGVPKRLGLEVRFDTEPIQGRLYDHEDERLDRRFSGWLGLIAAIEAAGTGEPLPRREQNGEA
jgi:hypothetical protein